MRPIWAEIHTFFISNAYFSTEAGGCLTKYEIFRKSAYLPLKYVFKMLFGISAIILHHSTPFYTSLWTLLAIFSEICFSACVAYKSVANKMIIKMRVWIQNGFNSGLKASSWTLDWLLGYHVGISTQCKFCIVLLNPQLIPMLRCYSKWRLCGGGGGSVGDAEVLYVITLH